MAVIFVLALSANAAAVGGKRSIEVGGVERVYTLYLPDNIESGGARPLLFILHGGGGNVELMMKDFGGRLIRLANGDGAIAVVPEELHKQYQNDETSANCPSVLVMNGTEDRWMPWKGGPVRALGDSKYGMVVSASKTYSFWKRRLGGGAASKAAVPDHNEDDGVTAEKRACRTADGRKELVFYSLKGGGHAAPSVEDESTRVRRGLNERMFGRKCRDFDAPDIVWPFLRSHARGKR